MAAEQAKRPAGCKGTSTVTYYPNGGLLQRTVRCEAIGCPRLVDPKTETIQLPDGAQVTPDQLHNIRTACTAEMFASCKRTLRKSSLN